MAGYVIVAIVGIVAVGLNAAARYQFGRDAIKKASKKDLPAIVRALTGRG